MPFRFWGSGGGGSGGGGGSPVAGASSMFSGRSANFTRASATVANVTGLSATLLAGRSYSWRLSIYWNNSDTVLGGIQIGFNGGTVIPSAFSSWLLMTDTGSGAVSVTSDTDITVTQPFTATSGPNPLEAYGHLVVGTAGTFIVQAGNASGTSTLTILAGSHLWFMDTTFS